MILLLTFLKHFLEKPSHFLIDEYFLILKFLILYDFLNLHLYYNLNIKFLNLFINLKKLLKIPLSYFIHDQKSLYIISLILILMQ